MQTTTTKLALLGSLYLCQGLPFGFFTQALPVLMRKEGISLQMIGLSSLLVMPWALKFLWAPWVDRWGSERWGRRRSWILPLQGLTALTMLTLAFFDLRGGLWVVCGGFLLANVLAATQDIATDGLAIDLLTERERGLGNGVQVAGYRVGMIIGGGPLLLAFHYLGWHSTFVVMSAILCVASIPILLTREPVVGAAPPSESNLALFKKFLSRPHMGTWLLVLILYKGGDALATGMLRPFLSDIGWDLKDIGWLLGTAGFTAGLLGALVGGVGVQWLGRRKALLCFGLFQALTVASYALAAFGVRDPWWIYAICSLEHFAGGTATAALFTVMMDLCDPQSAATDYTLQASLVVIATGTAAALSGFMAAGLGFGLHFLLSALLCACGVFASLWHPHANRLHTAKHPDLVHTGVI